MAKLKAYRKAESPHRKEKRNKDSREKNNEKEENKRKAPSGLIRR